MDSTERKNLQGANLIGANLQWASFVRANLQEANLQEANLQEANLQEADLRWSNLYKAKNLSFDQLFKVKTLHGVKLDEELLRSLKEKYSTLFELPN